MKDTVLIVVTVERAEPKAQDTIRSKPGSSAFSEGWERTFGSREEKPAPNKDLN